MNPLATRYLGLELVNPLVVGASPLPRDLTHARRLEDAGAAALVMHSLFEEDLLDEATWERIVHRGDAGDEARPHPPGTLERYLEQLMALKRALAIPVIASLNGVSRAGWLQHALELQQAGADALELNVYYLAGSPAESAADVEQRYLDLVAALRATVRIPFAVKLSPQFSALPHFVRRLEAEGANGLVLFNRFYQPDIDVDRLTLLHRPNPSHPDDVLLALHWIAILRGRTRCALAASGGVRSAQEVLKLLLAGADVVQLVGILLARGPRVLGEICSGLLAWLDTHGYASVEQMRGAFSEARISDPGGYERVHYREVLDHWRPPSGGWR
ncbi:dihydroorotate dehydrogenase (fumarate) [Plasticicumulans lactativorans]|uniref:Dihydroorotate dehydrogenase (Fumarate) n=1 Tax=Plasticicumulans lactativorans TaxID=1133106 RepID=A0A4R2KY88_9GAMM|nr:dihydroorotate dehydrogenase-like protein [Plasticicumulans lactativorans]TCO76349.1 dihydroorotate dehydrogenase (fumarate) [Plasticicumulans lactativorans]